VSALTATLTATMLVMKTLIPPMIESLRCRMHWHAPN
jgi:hypothetical protein